MNTLKLNTISINTIFFFLLKIWIFTNIIAAFFYIVMGDYVVDSTIDYKTTLFEKGFWQAIFFVAFIGLIYSIPAMLILGFMIKLWTNKKLILIPISIVLVFCSFYFTGFMSLKESKFYTLYPPIIYSIVISILVSILNIGKKEKLI